MISPLKMIEGVEGVWLVWLAAVTVVLRLTWITLRRWRRPRWRKLVLGEEGVSYSLSYVLVIPVYFLFVCIVYEATWLLIAKIGTLYAAHAGARSAVVWLWAEPESKRDPRIYQSVWSAMTPFVTGDPKWISQPPLSLVEIGRQSAEYGTVYKMYQGAANDKYANAPLTAIMRRYLTAATRTKCQYQVDSPQSGDVTVTVTYRAPLHIPGAGRILAPLSGLLNEYQIISKATLPNEAPENTSRTLGIDYKSD